MPLITSLINRLQKDFPELHFEKSDRFSWIPHNSSVTYASTPYSPHKLLHEVAHSLLGHSQYDRDIELLEIERAAWDKTILLAEQYQIPVSSSQIEEALDTYRDWMHARSVCPICTSIGLQSSHNTYRCIACASTWRVNEARTCELRRYKIEKIPHL